MNFLRVMLSVPSNAVPSSIIVPGSGTEPPVFPPPLPPVFPPPLPPVVPPVVAPCTKPVVVNGVVKGLVPPAPARKVPLTIPEPPTLNEYAVLLVMSGVKVYANISKKLGALPRAATSSGPNRFEAFIEESPLVPAKA